MIRKSKLRSKEIRTMAESKSDVVFTVDGEGLIVLGAGRSNLLVL